ncbi:MAG: DUF4178 domain-containing protein [Litoreibacter sp.]
MSDLNCPNCGDTVPAQLKLVKMMTCQSCQTTLTVLPNDLKQLGKSGELHDAERLFGLGDTIEFETQSIKILGHAQFSYGRGMWDEFWGTDKDGAGVWVSLDEGDIVVQRHIKKMMWPRVSAKPMAGQKITYLDDTLVISEVETATCISFRGSFDETLSLGETYTFVNIQGQSRALVSGELWPGGQLWFEGYWVDPFEISIKVTP